MIQMGTSRKWYNACLRVDTEKTTKMFRKCDEGEEERVGSRPWSNSSSESDLVSGTKQRMRTNPIAFPEQIVEVSI